MPGAGSPIVYRRDLVLLASRGLPLIAFGAVLTWQRSNHRPLEASHEIDCLGAEVTTRSQTASFAGPSEGGAREFFPAFAI